MADSRSVLHRPRIRRSGPRADRKLPRIRARDRIRGRVLSVSSPSRPEDLKITVRDLPTMAAGPTAGIRAAVPRAIIPRAAVLRMVRMPAEAVWETQGPSRVTDRAVSKDPSDPVQKAVRVTAGTAAMQAPDAAVTIMADVITGTAGTIGTISPARADLHLKQEARMQTRSGRKTRDA